MVTVECFIKLGSFDCIGAYRTCVFQTGSLIDRVFSTYKLMHTNQTLDFVRQKVSKFGVKTAYEISINSCPISTHRNIRRGSMQYLNECNGAV